MATDKTTVRFWLRTDRRNKKDGTAPIHLVYQIQGERKYYAVPGVKLFAINWDAIDQRAIYVDRSIVKDAGVNISFIITAKEATEINAKLQSLRNDISDIETRYRLDKKPFDLQMVIDRLKANKQPVTKKKDPAAIVADFIDQFVNDSAGTHQRGTLKVYTGLANHLRAFEATTGTSLTFESLDHGLLKRFQGYLAIQKNKTDKLGRKYESSMNNVTAAKQMSTLKTLLNYARTIYKVKVNQDYRDYKVIRKDSEFEVITLTMDEFAAVYNLDLSENKRLDTVRDVFCFACATGLRFGDLVQLRREHIRNDNTIRLTADKTGQKLVIPLNPISYSILQKYADKMRPLPMISNQKTNDYIKEIGKMAGIDTPIEKVRMRGVTKVVESFKKYELLSVHVGRKSFITLSLEKGIAIQEVMSLSGHTTFKAFKRYVDVNDARKKLVMADAWGPVNTLKIAT